MAFWICALYITDFVLQAASGAGQVLQLQGGGLVTGFCFCKIFLLWAFIIESMEGGQEYEILQFFLFMMS